MNLVLCMCEAGILILSCIPVHSSLPLKNSALWYL